MINAIIPLVSTVLDRLIPDNNAKEKVKQEIEKTLIANATQISLAQAETNKIEAAHRSVWVAGWRPCLGWISALSFLFMFILQPLAQWVCALLGLDVILPTFQTDVLMELTIALLGLAGLRSWEKAKGLTH
jgi:hypothetical protein